MNRSIYIYYGADIFENFHDIHIENSEVLSSSVGTCFSCLKTPNKLPIKDTYLGWSYLFFKTDDKIYHTGFWKPEANKYIRPISKTDDSEVIDITCGFNKSFKLMENGQCYIFHNQNFHPEIIQVEESNPRIKSVVTEDLHTLALTQDGKVYTLHIEERLSFKQLSMSLPIKEVACGKEHVLLLSNSGRVFSYGFGSRGQLGHGSIENQDKPVLIEALDGIEIKSITAGGWHSAVISNDGDLYMWGWNESGQLGLPCNELQGDKLPMDEIETVCCLPRIIELEDELAKLVGCGSRHTAALTEENHLWTWGRNTYGQLGHTKTLLSDKPEKIDLPSNFHPLKIKCKFWSTLIVGSLAVEI